MLLNRVFLCDKNCEKECSFSLWELADFVSFPAMSGTVVVSVVPGDPKKFHELDHLYLFDSKRYEDKQGVSM